MTHFSCNSCNFKIFVSPCRVHFFIRVVSCFLLCFSYFFVSCQIRIRVVFVSCHHVVSRITRSKFLTTEDILKIEKGMEHYRKISNCCMHFPLEIIVVQKQGLKFCEGTKPWWGFPPLKLLPKFKYFSQCKLANSMDKGPWKLLWQMSYYFIYQMCN